MFRRVARAALAAVAAAALIAAPGVSADPGPQCDTTVGESIDSYLNRHPDVRQDLAERGQRESPGSPNPVLDYLNRHPNVRQALITLSQQCAP